MKSMSRGYSSPSTNPLYIFLLVYAILASFFIYEKLTNAEISYVIATFPPVDCLKFEFGHKVYTNVERLFMCSFENNFVIN